MIAYCMSDFTSFSVNHVHRVANQLADNTVDMTNREVAFELNLQELQNRVLNIINCDAIGTKYVRT